MRKALLATLAASSVALCLSACDISDDYEAASRLNVTGVTSAAGDATVVANAVEETDDSGSDGNAGTNDADGTEDNGRPDPGEAIVTPLESDLGTISFRNDPRLGAGEGVDLSVYRVDITYRDANGQSRSFAPPLVQNVSVLVPKGETAELTNLVLVPLSMKAPASGRGVRDIFLDPISGAELTAVTTWTATVDVYARDEINDDDVHAQAGFTIVFKNPML